MTPFARMICAAIPPVFGPPSRPPAPLDRLAASIDQVLDAAAAQRSLPSVGALMVGASRLADRAIDAASDKPAVVHQLAHVLVTGAARVGLSVEVRAVGPTPSADAPRDADAWSREVAGHA